MPEKIKLEFYQPSAEFSPMPFWFWNDALDESEIIRQIHDFRSKGVMGFVIHPRIGIPDDLGYFDDRFMGYVKLAVSEAARNGMKVILYDEGMYPSGSAHGEVVAGNPEFATGGLRMIEYSCSGVMEIHPPLQAGERVIATLAVEKSEACCIVPGSERQLSDTGTCVHFETPTTGRWTVLFLVETFSGGTIRGIHFGEDDGEPGAPLSADLLNPAAVRKFIRLTHDRYYEVLRDYFGTTVIAMFTDEPDLLGRGARPGVKPWTKGFLDWYRSRGNTAEDLAALWFDTGDANGEKRKHYEQAVNERLEFSYYSQISKWCEDHGIALTGHPQASDDIGSLKHFHIPGQDIVWRWVAPEGELGVEGPHSTMAKCSSDAARHDGRRRNANECFGCCGPRGNHWAFSMDDMKWYLDWLFVRGVNLVYPHAFFYSIDGPKRSGERPPDVGPHNIWWPYYRDISDYIKRMSWLMTDSVNLTGIAVLCGSRHLPWAIVKPLYQQQIEFNYLELDTLLSGACQIKDGRIQVQNQQYRVLVVEDITLLTGELQERLRSFTQNGGIIILYNPERQPVWNEEPYSILTYGEIVPAVVSVIARDPVIYPKHPNLRVSHLLKNGRHFYLMTNEGDTAVKGDLRLGIIGALEIWDPWRGTSATPPRQVVTDQGISLPFYLERRASIIYAVDPSGQPVRSGSPADDPEFREWEFRGEWVATGPADTISLGERLVSWTEWPGMADFWGTVTYQTEIEIGDPQSISMIQLDLGGVGEIAHLYVNEADAGSALWRPYRFDITPYIKTGTNSLKIQVTNSLANRFGPERLPSGLLGPVKFISCVS